MREELLSLLKANKIFSEIREDELSKLLPKFTRFVLKKNELLYEQGDLPDYVYLLVSGELIILLKTTENKTRIMGDIQKGIIIGELSALGGEPRTMSVKAVEKSVLYKLSNKDFLDLSYRYPSIMYATVRPLISRVQQIVHTLTGPEKNNHIAIIPANNKISLQKFAEKFIPLTKKLASIILISDFLPDFANDHLTTLKQKIHAIEKNKKGSQQIVILAKSMDSLLIKIALETSPTVYIVADAQSKPDIEESLLQTLAHKKSPHKEVLTNLILLHSETTLVPQNTGVWLKKYPFNIYHHIKIDETRHFKRLLRFIRGRTVGLVLGGGGTRGFAHLGAIKAIRETKIPLDFIGGTSVGAIVAACYAMQESYSDAYEKFNQIVTSSRKSVSWRSLTWPIISLFDGYFFTQAIQTIFNNIQIEDLWIPYFCVSSNLTNFKEEIHRSGSLFEKTRASASIPGIIPPMIIDGEIHYDGGLLNNLPIDIMRQFLGKKAKIIAIELTASMHMLHTYNFPPTLTLRQALLIKLGFSQEHYIFPRFVDTFIRGLLIGSSVRAKQNRILATMLIDVSLRKFRLLHTNNKQAAKMLEIGYLETLTKIHQYKNKNI